MSKILFRVACGLFLFAAPIMLTGCEGDTKPAAPAAGAGTTAPAAPGKDAPGK